MSGVVTLSIELELGWGMHDMNKFDHLSPDRSAEDRALTRLLDACDRNDLPISFNIVGHLFDEACNGAHSGPYPTGWWNNDPGTNVTEDPLFYAPDMIDEITGRATPHELCSHTFSHVLADESSKELLDHELSLSREVHEAYGLPEPTSIVMPRHHDVDFSLLVQHGFTTIRRPIREYGYEGGKLGKLWWLFTRPHPACEIRQTAGIVESTCTPHPSLSALTLPTGQGPPHPIYTALPERLRTAFQRRYLQGAIERAVEQSAHVHLWTHLYNLANDVQWDAIKPSLETLTQKRAQGDIEIATMNQLSDHIDTI